MQALLLIDIQNDYFPGGRYALERIEEASRTSAELLDHFRSQRLPLVHIRHEFAGPDAPFFQPGTLGSEIHASVAPQAGEIEITKNFVNSFAQTDLKSILDKHGVDSLVICGAMSQMCVEGTTRAAADLGYKCQVIHDACATRDQQFGERLIRAADVHGTAMATLGFAFAEVLTFDEWRAR
jgi:nicotinamidase-related amidase